MKKKKMKEKNMIEEKDDERCVFLFRRYCHKMKAILGAAPPSMMVSIPPSSSYLLLDLLGKLIVWLDDSRVPLEPGVN
jgi:hypothetical protein